MHPQHLQALEQSITGREVFFRKDELIVSKTDMKGTITYANDVFLRVAGYTAEQTLGKPHNILRHPHMPGSIFHLLWERITNGQEIFAYVINRCANGDHYWVLAHVTPSYDSHGQLVGYHSNRRLPERHAVDAVAPLYQAILQAEKQQTHYKDGIQAGRQHLQQWLNQQGVSYDALVHQL